MFNGIYFVDIEGVLWVLVSMCKLFSKWFDYILFRDCKIEFKYYYSYWLVL